MLLRRWGHGLGAAALLYGLATTGHAQLIPVPPPEPPADQGTTAAGTPDAGGAKAPDVADRTAAVRQARRDVDAVQAGTKRDATITRILRDWDRLEDDSQELAEDLDRAREQGVASDILRDRLNAARQRHDDLSEWSRVLQGEVDRLDALQDQASQLLNVWQARSRSTDPAWAEIGPLVDAMLARLEPLPGQLTSLEDQIASRLNAMIEREHRLEQAIDAGRTEYRRRGSVGWFEVVGPPWNIQPAPTLRDMRTHAAERWSLNLEVLRAYLARHPAPYFVQLLLWAAGAYLLLRAKGRRRQGAVEITEPSLDEVVAAVQRRALAGGFLLAVALGGLLHGDPPSLHRAFLHSAGVLSAVLVLSAERRGSPGPALYLLWLLVVCDWIQALALGPVTVGRLVLDGELVVLVGLCSLMQARVETTDDAHLAYRRWLPGLYRGLRTAALAAVLADVCGLEKIASNLGRAALHGAYLLAISLGLYWSGLAAASALCHEPLARPFRALQARRSLVLPWVIRTSHIVLPIAWVWVVSDSLGFRGPLGDTLTAAWDAHLSFGEVQISLGDVLLFGVVVWASLFVSRLLRAVLEDDVLSRAALPSGVPYAISTTAHYVVVMLGTFLAISAAGVDMSRFTVLAGAFGVGVGFGMQNVVNNFVSGLILLYERPIKVGDTIEVETIQGEVERIGIRSSTVRTYGGAEVLVPNATLVSTKVINFTLNDRSRRIELPIGVAYGTDPSAMLDLLRKVAKSHPAVLPSPEPLALFVAFGQSSLDFELKAWVADFDEGSRVRSDLAIALNAALKEAGISVPFPQRELIIRNPATEPPKAP